MASLCLSRSAFATLTAGAVLFMSQGHWPSVQAQQSTSQSAERGRSPDAVVPPLIQHSGRLHDAAGRPLTGNVSATFSVYDEQQFGKLLWMEVQNVELDKNGGYTTLLGSFSPEGLPLDLFTTGGERWLEIHASGHPEESRTLMVSVPYAFKAQDAETLGGRPATDYLLASAANLTTTETSTSGDRLVAAAPPGGGGGSSFATLGANTFTGTQTIDTGNLDLDPSTATTGNITKNGTRFLHNFGTNNTFLGVNAGNLAMTGIQNTATGAFALPANTTGFANMASGYQALLSNTTGSANTASGANALFSNTTGGSNTANGFTALQLNTTGAANTASGTNALFTNTIGNNNTASGASALQNNTTGNTNTASGIQALFSNTTGFNNIAVGAGAGQSATTGSNNIYLGANVNGVADESNTIYLGVQGTQTKTVIAGIRGTAVTGGEPVVIDAAGRLGSGAVAPGANTVGSAQVIDDSLTASDLAPNSVTASELAASSVTADKVAFNYAGSTSAGGSATDVACVGCVAASEVSFSFATLGANTFTGTQTIDTGNLDLDPSTATTGNLTKNGSRFLHNFGTDNTFLGVNAGNVTMTGQSNTATGRDALADNTTGNQNTAYGTHALEHNTTGLQNTASGENALRGNTSGSQNTASGIAALQFNFTGSGNTASGVAALLQNKGSANVAVGQNAGFSATTGSNNIYLGANVSGVAGEDNTMYLGKQGTQTTTYIAGVRGTTVTGGEAVLIDAAGRLGSGAVAPGANTVGSAQVIDDSLTASDLAPNSVTGSELAAGSVTADKVAFNYAGSTSAGGPATDVACLGCVSASEVSFSFATLGVNTFTGTQTIDTGNLDLDPSTATTGNITKNGARFLHNFGSGNTFLGVDAGNVTMTGTGNTANGQGALAGNTTGIFNTANGLGALANNTTGGTNTASGVSALGTNGAGPDNAAFGFQALLNNTSGSSNTAIGSRALNFNGTGINNVAVGVGAGYENTSGSTNVAVGSGAGFNATTGSNNIYLGAGVVGVAGEANTMYLGKQGTQTTTYIAGVRGTTTVNPDAIWVMIDSAGQLGTVSSSRRFKEDIRDMSDTSRRLFQLRPVTFRYKQAYGDGSKPIQYGLIAEEVAAAFPELAVRNADGVVETVHYETLNVLLLNELQKQHQEVQRQRERIDALEQRLNELLE